ncbi:MAG: hypothetical protein RBT65_13945 [Methanolobus sp.]|nr:hypothetical protein [Methanolobus sp.]
MKINMRFGIGALLTAMLLVSMAFVPAVSATEVTNVTENTEDRNIGIQSLVKSVPISGYLKPTSETDTFSFYVPAGAGWDRVTADVLVSNIHTLDAFGDISIELVDPDDKKVDGDTLYGETHLNFDYSPGYDLTAGTWHIYVKGVDLNGQPGYDGGAYIYN